MIQNLFNSIEQKFKLQILKRKWRRRNPHNETQVVNLRFPFDRVTVASGTYGKLEVYSWYQEEEYLKIGHFVSIANHVQFFLGGNHPHHFLSTYPFKVKHQLQAEEATSKGKITVEDDVWIGSNAMILSGVTIGQGAVVAAGAVVAKDVAPYSIVAGNPAKVVSYRFSEAVIEELKQLDYSKLDADKAKDNIPLFYTAVTAENAAELVREFQNICSKKS